MYLFTSEFDIFSYAKMTNIVLKNVGVFLAKEYGTVIYFCLKSKMYSYMLCLKQAL